MTPPLPSDFQVQSRRSEIGLDTKSASPPTAAYVSKDDQLWIMSSNNGGGGNVTVNARLLLPDGTIVLNQWPLAMLNLRPAQYQSIRLPECFILSVAAVTNYTSNGGLSFVEIILSRANPNGFNAAQILAQGYASTNQAVSWPDGVQSDSLNCVGGLRSITGATPAAGQDISETVPNNTRWSLRSIKFTLATSATVATRLVTLELDDGTTSFARIVQPGSHAASNTFIYTFAGGLVNSSTVANIVSANLLTPCQLNAGYRIRTNTTSLQVGDQFSAVQYVVEEWLEP